MVVKLETVINTMDLAAQVLTKASVVIEKAKKLGVDVDADIVLARQQGE